MRRRSRSLWVVVDDGDRRRHPDADRRGVREAGAVAPVRRHERDRRREHRPRPVPRPDPGSSRSGSTIMTALFRKIDRPTAARYSFLLSIPAVGGAGLLELIKERHHLGALGWTPIVISIVVSFISGYASIWFLLRYLRTHTTHVFIYYRYVLGLAMIALLASGWLNLKLQSARIRSSEDPSPSALRHSVSCHLFGSTWIFGDVPVLLGEVEAVADDELRVDGEADVVGLELHLRAAGLSRNVADARRRARRDRA